MPYTINDDPVELPEPESIDGVTFVPLAKVAELLGGTVTWDHASHTAEVELNDKTARVTAEHGTVEIGDDTYVLPGHPTMGGGNLWVPIILFQDVFGATVSDDGDGNVSLSS